MFATAGTRGMARRLQRLIESRDIFGVYQRLLSVDGYTPRLLVGRSGRLPIIVGPHTDPAFANGTAAATAAVCHPGPGFDDHRDAIIVSDEIEDYGRRHADIAEETLAHEIFHAFEHGIAGRDNYGPNWLDEAAAQWAAQLHFHITAGSTREFDDAFLLHPEIPLDHFGGRSDTELAHPYGAWRVLQNISVGTERESLVARLLVTIYRDLRTESGDHVTQELIDNFPAGAVLLGDPGGALEFRNEMTFFWEEHLVPRDFSYGSGGPAVPMQHHDSLSSGAGSGRDGHTQSWELDAAPLAASTIEIATPAGEQIHARVVLPADSGFGANWSISGFGGFYALGPDDAMLGPIDCDPGPLRFVFINTGDHPQAAELQLTSFGPDSC